MSLFLIIINYDLSVCKALQIHITKRLQSDYMKAGKKEVNIKQWLRSAEKVAVQLL